MWCMNEWPIRLRLEIVRGAQEPSQRRYMMHCLHQHLLQTANHRLAPLVARQLKLRASDASPLSHRDHGRTKAPNSAPQGRVSKKQRAPGSLFTPLSLFFSARPPDSGVLCEALPPRATRSRLFVSVSEGTGAKEVVTARSLSARVGSVQVTDCGGILTLSAIVSVHKPGRGGRLATPVPRPRNKKIVHPLSRFLSRWRGSEHRIINFHLIF